MDPDVVHSAQVEIAEAYDLTPEQMDSAAFLLLRYGNRDQQHPGSVPGEESEGRRLPLIPPPQAREMYPYSQHNPPPRGLVQRRFYGGSTGSGGTASGTPASSRYYDHMGGVQPDDIRDFNCYSESALLKPHQQDDRQTVPQQQFSTTSLLSASNSRPLQRLSTSSSYNTTTDDEELTSSGMTTFRDTNTPSNSRRRRRTSSNEGAGGTDLMYVTAL